MQFAMNKFAIARHTPDSGRSFYDGPDECILLLCTLAADDGDILPGYKDGVALARVSPVGFYSGVVALTEDTPVVAAYEPRTEGEEPRKALRAVSDAPPCEAAYVEVVLYRNDVLAENEENDTDPADGEVWEVISINASPTEASTPIPPMALIYNHLQMSGGSDSRMTDGEFVESLRVSMAFWKNHAVRAPLVTRTDEDGDWKLVTMNVWAQA